MKPEDHILDIVSNHLKISIDEMKGRTRQRAVVEAKQVFCYLCRNLLPLSFKQIGNILNIDHATVLHSVKAIEDRMFIYPREKTSIENLMIMVKGRIDVLMPDLITINEEIYMENNFYTNLELNNK